MEYSSSRRRLLIAYGVVPLVPVAATVALFFAPGLNVRGGHAEASQPAQNARCDLTIRRGQTVTISQALLRNPCAPIRPRAGAGEEHSRPRFSIQPVPVIR